MTDRACRHGFTECEECDATEASLPPDATTRFVAGPSSFEARIDCYSEGPEPEPPKPTKRVILVSRRGEIRGAEMDADALALSVQHGGLFSLESGAPEKYWLCGVVTDTAVQCWDAWGVHVFMQDRNVYTLDGAEVVKVDGFIDDSFLGAGFKPCASEASPSPEPSETEPPA